LTEVLLVDLVARLPVGMTDVGFSGDLMLLFGVI
jgi:hypothetical protein